MRTAPSFKQAFRSWATMIVGIALLFAVSDSAWAAQWVVVIPGDATKSEWSIDMDSLSVSSGWVGAWEKIELRAAEQTAFDESKTYQSNHRLVRYNCMARQSQLLEFYDYSGENLSGDVVSSTQLASIRFRKPIVFDVRNVRPGSPQEQLLMAVCEAAADRGLLTEPLPWGRKARLSGSLALENGTLGVAAFLLPATLLCFPLVYFVWRKRTKRSVETKFVAAMAVASWLLSVVLWTSFAPQIANLIRAPNEGVLMFVIGLAAAICVVLVMHLLTTPKAAQP